MQQHWNHETAPAFAKVKGGQLVRLSTTLPAFDDETDNLSELNTNQLVSAGWYSVASCPEPNEGVPARSVYDLASVDNGAGTCTLTKE